MRLVDLNYSFECDWLIELSNNKLSNNKLTDNKLSNNKLPNNKLSDNKLSNNKLSDYKLSNHKLFDNNLASELVENRLSSLEVKASFEKAYLIFLNNFLCLA